MEDALVPQDKRGADLISRITILAGALMFVATKRQKKSVTIVPSAAMSQTSIAQRLPMEAALVNKKVMRSAERT